MIVAIMSVRIVYGLMSHKKIQRRTSKKVSIADRGALSKNFTLENMTIAHVTNSSLPMFTNINSRSAIKNNEPDFLDNETI